MSENRFGSSKSDFERLLSPFLTSDGGSQEVQVDQTGSGNLLAMGLAEPKDGSNDYLG